MNGTLTHISCKFHNFVRPVCIMMTTPFFSSTIEMTNLTMNEKQELGSNKFCNLLQYSFYHSYADNSILGAAYYTYFLTCKIEVY